MGWWKRFRQNFSKKKYCIWHMSPLKSSKNDIFMFPRTNFFQNGMKMCRIKLSIDWWKKIRGSVILKYKNLTVRGQNLPEVEPEVVVILGFRQFFQHKKKAYLNLSHLRYEPSQTALLCWSTNRFSKFGIKSPKNLYPPGLWPVDGGSPRFIS